MSSRNPRLETRNNINSSARSAGLILSKAAFLALVGGAVFADKVHAAIPTVGAATEVPNVNTSSADQRTMVVLDSGEQAYIEETSLGGDGTVMFVDPSATTPSATELCGAGSFGTSFDAAVTSLDLASSSTIRAYVYGDFLGNNFRALTDASGASSDYSSCTEIVLSGTGHSETNFFDSYDYSTGGQDLTEWNGRDNDVELSDGTVLGAIGTEEGAPGRCLGTDTVFYQIGDETTNAEIWVYDGSTSSYVTDGAFPRCNGSTLHYSEHDGRTWNLYEAPITFTTEPVDNDGDSYDTDSDCNDTDATVYPGATEVSNDGVDTDCDNNADSPEFTSIEVNGETLENGATIYALLGEAITFKASGQDEETLSSNLDFTYDLTGDVSALRLSGSSGETISFTPDGTGTIQVVLTMTDGEGNLQTFEFTIITGLDPDTIADGDLEEGTIVVDGEGATTVESDGVAWGDGEFVIVDGYVTYTGTPDTIYTGVTADGTIVASVQALNPEGDGSIEATGFLAMGISSRPMYFASPAAPPSESSSYGEYSDNENPDYQFIVSTNAGVEFWGVHTNSTNSALELDGNERSLDGLPIELYLSDAVDADESDEPVDTGEPGDTGIDDTGVEDTEDTDRPDRDRPESDKPTDSDDGGCSTVPGGTPNNGAGFLLALGAIALTVRRQFGSKS